MKRTKRRVVETEEREPRTLILGVHTPVMKHDPLYHYEEFKQLTETANITPAAELQMKLRSIDNALFFTKGKLHELIEFCTNEKIEVIVISAILSPMQERNLTDTLGCKIFDRTALIIEIFRRAATSSEGKIQVEMALLEHLRSRLAGHGKDMAQQEGFVGARGPGESMKESLRRYYDEKMRQARKRLNQVASSREVQRKKRLRQGHPLVCLVGYTNAGKSTLLNTLTKSNVLAEDKLFATLDTTTRELFLGENKKALLSDTVGFISELPARLIEAFKSTLDELQYATLLVHVIDVSNKAWQEHITVVNDTLKELNVSAPILHVFNKVDLIDEENKEALLEKIKRFEPHVVTHARDKEGTASVLEYLSEVISQ